MKNFGQHFGLLREVLLNQASCKFDEQSEVASLAVCLLHKRSFGDPGSPFFSKHKAPLEPKHL